MLRSTSNAIARCKSIQILAVRGQPKSIARYWDGLCKRRNIARQYATFVNSQKDGVTNASRVLRIAKRVVDDRQYAIWDTVLKRITKYESSPRRRRIGVLAGEDCIKEREELISALVGEAMADTEVRDAVQARWVSVPSSAERIKIRYGEKLARFGPILEIPSKSLAALNVEVVEIREIRSAPELLTTDVPIFLTSSHVPSLVTRHPNTLLVQLSSTEPSENGKRVTSPPTSAALVINALNERLDAIENNRDSYRTEALLSLLDECSFELRSASQDLEAARMNAHALEEQIDEYIAQLDTQLSEINVSQLVQENKRTLQTSFDKFKWYRIWDIDTVGDQISYHVATGYGVALERKLEWYAGLMAASQSRIRHLCADFMQMIPRSLDAATIQNDIERIQSTTPFVASSTFTGIVAHRRRQLMESVTNRMQARFLRRVYIAMAGMPIAAGAPAMLWANELLSSTYALPSGLLAILLCVRHVSAGWGKARTHWWAQYDRINSGMEDDVAALVKRTKDSQVINLPRTLLFYVDQAVTRRETIVRQLENEVKDAKKSMES